MFIFRYDSNITGHVTLRISDYQICVVVSTYRWQPQAESTSERDRWMLALMHVSRHALDVGDDPTAALLSRYLNNTRIYGDVLNHQVSRYVKCT
jgi:hypothetical protein